jgi:hypothetical protein
MGCRIGHDHEPEAAGGFAETSAAHHPHQLDLFVALLGEVPLRWRRRWLG